MGMYTRMTGSIYIEPPLNHQEIRLFEATKPVWTQLDIYEKEIDTPEGVLKTRSASELEVITFDAKNYGVSGEIQTLVNLFPDRVFSGVIDCVFEDVNFEGDKLDGIYRLAVHKGKVETIEPKVTWPEWLQV